MGGNKFKKLITGLLLLVNILTLLGGVFVPQKAEADTLDQFSAEDVVDIFNTNTELLLPVATAAVLAGNPILTATGMAANGGYLALKDIASATENGLQFTDNDHISIRGNSGIGITLDRLSSCDHDYFCYAPDTTKALIMLLSPITTPAGLALQGVKPGILVNKETKKTTLGLLVLAPNFTLNIDNLVDTEVVANTRSLDTHIALDIGLDLDVKNHERAPYIFSVKKVNLPGGSVFNGMSGSIVFDEPPTNPQFFKNLKNKTGHVSYMYWGTAEETFDIDSVENMYDSASSSLKFSGLKNESIFNRVNNLYTNTKYQVSLWGAKGYTDCTTGEVKEIPGLGIGNPAGCTEEYKGDLFFTLDETGKISVISPRAGEEVNNGKIFNESLFLAGWTLKSSPLDKALSGAIKTLAGFVGSFMKTAVSGINNLLDGTANIVLGEVGKSTTGVEAAWTKIRNVALTLLIMALIIIAFANVLQIDIEHYGLNRMIPRIIISIIMAYLSWIIVTFFFDFGKALQDQAWGLLAGGKNGSGLQALGNISINTPTSGDIASKAGAIIVLLVLLIGILICLIVLWFSLLVRVVVLSFLLAVAPLAFILNIMPFTSKLYKQWWSEFFKWMFMGPVAVVIIALGSVIASGSFGFSGAMTLSGDSTSPSGAGWNMLIGLLILGASIYFAATLPQKWGGGIMKGWNKAGKGLNKWVGNTTGITGAKNLIGNRIKSWGDNKSTLAANRLARLGTLGKVGTTADVLKRQQYDAAVTEAGKQIGVSSSDTPTLISGFKSAKNGYEKAAIMREMADRGDLEKLYAADNTIDMNTGAWKSGTDTAQHAARVRAGKAVMSLMGKDQALEKSILSNQGELVVAARNALQEDQSTLGDYARSKYNGLIAGQKNKSLKEKRMNILDEIDPSEIDKFMTEFDISKMNDSQASSAKAQAKYKAYRERAQQQQAVEYANDASLRTSLQTEAEAENTAIDAANTAASKQKQMAQAVSRAESDARGAGAVQDEAERINRSLP